MSTVGSANGRSGRVVTKSPLFFSRERELQTYYPMLGQAVEAVSWELARNAEQFSRHVAGSTWVRETERAVSVPVLWIYFTIWTGQVRLEFIAVPGASIPDSPPDDDIPF